MPIEEIIQPTEIIETPAVEDAVLQLGDGGEGGEKVEPIDDVEEFPDTFDEEPGSIDNKGLLKILRDRDVANTRRIRELEQRASQPALVHTEEPTLEGCDWDDVKFKAEFVAWQKNEAAIAEAAKVQTNDNESATQSWQEELQTYKANAVKLAKPDFDASEELVISALSNAQQTTIIMAAKHPAQLIYALGRSPNRLAQLAQITNPIKLAAEVARIEGSRMMPRKEPPNIDTPARGSARLSQTAPSDVTEAKLLAAAEKDPSKFDAYRQHMREKRKAA